MKTIRRILFAPSVLALGLSLCTATMTQASVTKVGNGDDGADLEALKLIKSGLIVTTRQRAVETLRNLNVIGVPGMGLLIPELERTDLMMASKDVHPTGEQVGSLEISVDKGAVYARTFAEPYAATRFFPAAEKLTPEQLVALHIHEALHRALPSNVRGDEDAVMHLTMALTSPGANFDRVRQVASLYMPVPSAANYRGPAAEMTTSIQTAPVTLPAKSKISFTYDFDSYGERKGGLGYLQLHGLALRSSLGGFKSIGGYAIEPVARARAKFAGHYGMNTTVGTSSIDVEGRIQTDEHTQVGPFARYTMGSLDETYRDSTDRDVISLGAFYRASFAQAYFDMTTFYSPASTAQVRSNTVEYKPIFSVNGRTGLKWNNLFFGVIGEFHSFEREELYNDYSVTYLPAVPITRSYRILAIGPEIGYESDNFQFKAFAKWIANDTTARLEYMGDVMDRGASRSALGTSLSMLF